MVELVTSETPALAAANRVAEALRLTAGDSPRLGIAGGSVLAALPLLRERLPAGLWSALRLTWVDERCVPLASPDSNHGQALRAGYLDPKAPPGFELPLYLDDETAQAAGARVTSALATHFDSALDVLLLGMGEDGHIASLFPGHPICRVAGLVAPIFDSPKPPPQRITLTLPLLAKAEQVVLLVQGESKRVALGRLLLGDPALPAAALHRVTVVTDLGL